MSASNETKTLDLGGSTAQSRETANGGGMGVENRLSLQWEPYLGENKMGASFTCTWLWCATAWYLSRKVFPWRASSALLTWFSPVKCLEGEPGSARPQPVQWELFCQTPRGLVPFAFRNSSWCLPLASSAFVYHEIVRNGDEVTS